MRRIDDPIVLRDCLSRLSDIGHLTPAQARLLLASRGIRAQQKALEAALQGFGRVGLPVPKQSKQRKPRLKPLDDLPLTPREREIMERLRRLRARNVEEEA